MIGRLRPQQEVEELLIAFLSPELRLRVHTQGGQSLPEQAPCNCPTDARGLARVRRTLRRALACRRQRLGRSVTNERRLNVLGVEPLPVLHALAHALGEVVGIRVRLAGRHGARGRVHRAGKVP